MESIRDGNLIFVRLKTNEDLLKSLESVAKKHEIQTGIILSGVGMIKNFEIGYFKAKKDYETTRYRLPHELISLTGTIIKQGKDYLIHAHASAANDLHKVFGGHLFKAKVNITNEIVLYVSSAKLKRKLDPENGLKVLSLDS